MFGCKNFPDFIYLCHSLRKKNLNLAQLRGNLFGFVSVAPILDPPFPRHNGVALR